MGHPAAAKASTERKTDAVDRQRRLQEAIVVREVPARRAAATTAPTEAPAGRKPGVDRWQMMTSTMTTTRTTTVYTGRRTVGLDWTAAAVVVAV